MNNSNNQEPVKIKYNDISGSGAFSSIIFTAIATALMAIIATYLK